MVSGFMRRRLRGSLIRDGEGSIHGGGGNPGGGASFLVGLQVRCERGFCLREFSSTSVLPPLRT